MSKRVRTFVAVSITSDVRDRLVALQDALGRVADDVKWVEPENLHLTLRFLGEVDEQELYAVCKSAQQAVRDHDSFEMSVAGVGAFPSSQRPRIIWAGVGQGREELVAVHGSLERTFRSQGFPGEDRPYTPHLTLGRIRAAARDPSRMVELLAARRDWAAGSVRVHEVVVMSSQLSPDGPVYAVMGRARLGGD